MSRNRWSQMKHLSENNETYISHMLFASKIAVYLSVSSTFFLVHSIFPFVKIPDIFNLNAVCNNVKKWNEHAEQRKKL